MRKEFKSFELKEISDFLIHNIRKLKIRAAYEEGGINKAKEVA